MKISGPFKFAACGEDDEPPFRRYDCPNYELCLNVAAALNWDSFSCINCNKKVNEKLFWQAHHAQKQDTVADALCDIPSLTTLKIKKL